MVNLVNSTLHLKTLLDYLFDLAFFYSMLFRVLQSKYRLPMAAAVALIGHHAILNISFEFLHKTLCLTVPETEVASWSSRRVAPSAGSSCTTIGLFQAKAGAHNLPAQLEALQGEQDPEGVFPMSTPSRGRQLWQILGLYLQQKMSKYLQNSYFYITFLNTKDK